jgi:hypothetical protein
VSQRIYTAVLASPKAPTVRPALPLTWVNVRRRSSAYVALHNYTEPAGR